MNYPMLKLLIIVMVIVAGCTRNPAISTGGGGIETVSLAGNAVYDQTNKPAANAHVRLRVSSFLSDTAAAGKQSAAFADVLTDADGHFRIDSVDTGDYCIEITDNVTHAVLIRQFVAGYNQQVNLGVAALKPFGSIAGSIGKCAASVNRFVRIEGLDRCIQVDSTGIFTMPDIPSGTFRLSIVSSLESAGELTFDSILTYSGKTTALSYSGWKYSRRIYMNTTASGADVSSTLTGFPVLIRLNAAAFDFGEAQTDGGDIRFENSGGASMPYAISRWNRSDSQAEIWVSVDTVRGNDSNQFFVMSWGNPYAAGSDSSAAVFGANHGFTAVWHLDGNCVDASGNGHDGTNYGAIDSTGIIGVAKEFRGTDSIQVSGLLGMPASVTLSAWVNVDTAIAYGQEIVSIGDAVLMRAEEPDTGMAAYFAQDTNDFVPVASRRFYAKTGWHFAAFAFDNVSHTHTLYIDGAAVCVVTNYNPINYLGQGSNTLIGAHGNGKEGYNSHALIDEVSVSGISRSSDWIRLCYMNQQIDDKLLVVK